MPTPNFNLPLINGASPISIVNDMNGLATAVDSEMAKLATKGDIDSVKLIANQAAKDATNANSAATRAESTSGNATETASTALSNSNTAIARAEQANTTANEANQIATLAQDSVQKFISATITTINRANAADNGVLNISDASIIGTNASDGFVVVQTEWYYFIEFRGISLPRQDAYKVVGEFVKTDVLKELTWIYCVIPGYSTAANELGFTREPESSNTLRLQGRCSTQTRVSGWVILPRTATAH